MKNASFTVYSSVLPERVKDVNDFLVDSKEDFVKWVHVQKDKLKEINNKDISKKKIENKNVKTKSKPNKSDRGMER